MGLRVTLAGIDITSHVDESSINITDTLGQGAGTGAANSAGRASTCTIIVDSSLGNMTSAVGAGTIVHSAKLVGLGEIRIFDATNVCIFGGFATKFTDDTKKKTLRTQIDCIDYWQYLDHIIINEVYNGVTDIFIIRDILTKHVPWIDRSRLPTQPVFLFGPKNLRNVSVQKAIGKITDITGYQTWIGTDKKIHYESPFTASTAPFQLSDKPDFRHKFQRGIAKYEIDLNAVINRVYFFGGKKPSGNKTVDLSTQANGSNKIFTVPYYPHQSTDGKYHLKINGGTDKVLGFAGGSAKSDKLHSDGGTADALLDADARTITWDTAPAAGATVTIVMQFQLPMVVVLTNEASRRYFGQYFDGIISDETVFDNPTAVSRCRILLLEQAFGLTSIQVTCWRPGLVSGHILKLEDAVRGINNSYIIQKVETKPLGAGNFEYTVDLGAWNWNLIDAIKQSAHFSTSQDTSQQEEQTPVDVAQMIELLTLSDAFTKRVANYGGYHAHATVLNDGHDAYCGFSSITT